MPNKLLSLAAAASRILPAPLKRALYRIGPLARLIRRSLNRAAPSGLTQVTVAAGGLEGLPVLLNLQTEKDYWLGTYEMDLQSAVRELVHPGMTVYDVGANIGYVSLLLAHAVDPFPGGATPHGQVFSFEPLPANLDRLRSNLALNPSLPVTVVPAAIIDRSHPVKFFIHDSTSMGKAEGSAGRQDVSYRSEIQVEGLSLDEFAYTQSKSVPQIIKMDIEGGEVLALQGMARLLNEARPTLLIELHGPEAARTSWDTLTAADYSIRPMAPGSAPLTRFEDLDWKAYIIAEPK